MKLKQIKKTAAAELEIGDYTILFSYETPVAFHVCPGGFFRTEDFHSVTTSKHVNQFVRRHGGDLANVKRVSQESIEKATVELRKSGNV